MKAPVARAWLVLAGVVVAGGCAGLSKVQLTLPGRHVLLREQLKVHSDFPLAAQHRLLEDLTARRYDISRQLAQPISDEPIHVYLFASAERFKTFMRVYHPEFPERRAFFMETDTRLVVYAHWGDRVAEDLRHEVTHGYLHSMVPQLPLWLDEGLAEYFEVPRGRRGMNSGHLELLCGLLEQGRWQADLRRLEQIDSVFAMTQEDYAQAWAWVHLLLQSDQRRAGVLHDYLERLRCEGTAQPLSLCLESEFGSAEEALVGHIHRLAASAAR